MKVARVAVPYKAKGRKSRLSAILTAAGRRELADCMLLDVLDAISGAGMLDGCTVVSSDGDALSTAERAGAKGTAEKSDKGVNSAVEAAIKGLRPDEWVMVVPADLPELRPEDLRRALRLFSLGYVVLAPSGGLDGTNLLVFPSSGFCLSYDEDSFWGHVSEAARRGLRLAVISSRGLSSDVDSPEDLRRLARARINSRGAKFARKAEATWGYS